MKISVFAILICSFLLTMACNNGHEHSHDNDDHDHDQEMVDAINTKDTISEERFLKWRSSWSANGEAYMDTATLFQYFTMPVVDLEGVLEEKAKGTKFYFGLEEKDKAFMLKFMLVGTDKKGNDLIDYAAQNYVYDFTRLCPPICPN